MVVTLHGDFAYLGTAGVVQVKGCVIGKVNTPEWHLRQQRQAGEVREMSDASVVLRVSNYHLAKAEAQMYVSRWNSTHLQDSPVVDDLLVLFGAARKAVCKGRRLTELQILSLQASATA